MLFVNKQNLLQKTLSPSFRINFLNAINYIFASKFLATWQKYWALEMLSWIF